MCQRSASGLLGLVTVDTDGRPVRRRIRLDQLPDTIRAQLLPFITRRLLVLDAIPGGPVTVEIAHERLLTAWPPLAQAITDATDRLRQRAQAETAADAWQRDGQPSGQLWNHNRASTALATLALTTSPPPHACSWQPAAAAAFMSTRLPGAPAPTISAGLTAVRAQWLVPPRPVLPPVPPRPVPPP